MIIIHCSSMEKYNVRYVSDLMGLGVTSREHNSLDCEKLKLDPNLIEGEKLKLSIFSTSQKKICLTILCRNKQLNLICFFQLVTDCYQYLPTDLLS